MVTWPLRSPYPWAPGPATTKSAWSAGTTTLGQATLTVPEAAITVATPESRRGTEVRVAGSNFPAESFVRLSYGDGGDLSQGDEPVGFGQADARGSFEVRFPVPLTAVIGRTHKITATVEQVSGGEATAISAEAIIQCPPVR